MIATCLGGPIIKHERKSAEFRQSGQRFGVVSNLFEAKKACSPAFQTKGAPQSMQMRFFILKI